jgi:hypothetical protein
VLYIGVLSAVHWELASCILSLPLLHLSLLDNFCLCPRVETQRPTVLPGATPCWAHSSMKAMTLCHGPSLSLSSHVGYTIALSRVRRIGSGHPQIPNPDDAQVHYIKRHSNHI